MASPTVETTNTSAETADVPSDDPHTVSLPSGISAGDYLVIVVSVEALGTVTSNPSGFTKRFDETEGSTTEQDSQLIYWDKEATGSEGSTVTFTLDTPSKSAHATYRISGAADPGTTAPDIATKATGSSTSPDPPNLDASTSKDYLWLALASQDDNAGGGFAGFPTNYSNGLTIGDGSEAHVGIASRQLTASSEDPGAFSANNSARWVTTTVAVHPAATGVTVNLGTATFNLDAGASLGVNHELSPVVFNFAPQILQVAGEGLGVPLGTVTFDLSPQGLSWVRRRAIGTVAFDFNARTLGVDTSLTVPFGLYSTYHAIGAREDLHPDDDEDKHPRREDLSLPNE